jgi:hypothetical protein
MATQQPTPEASTAAAHASAELRRVTGRRVAGRSWRAVLAWATRAGDGIWLEPAGPVPGNARGERVAGPLLAVAVTAAVCLGRRRQSLRNPCGELNGSRVDNGL